MRVLICGWASLADGEATAGDVLALDRVAAVLTAADIANVACLSGGVRPGAPDISAQDPADFTHLVFVCGPIHGGAIMDLHRRFDRCVRIAVGVSVIDPADATVTGFAAVIARDGLGPPRVDLAAGTAVGEVPVVGFVQAPGQPEYGGMRRHDRVHAALAARLDAADCAVVPVDTRLGVDPGAMFRTPPSSTRCSAGSTRWSAHGCTGWSCRYGPGYRWSRSTRCSGAARSPRRPVPRTGPP